MCYQCLVSEKGLPCSLELIAIDHSTWEFEVILSYIQFKTNLVSETKSRKNRREGGGVEEPAKTITRAAVHGAEARLGNTPPSRFRPSTPPPALSCTGLAKASCRVTS